MIILQWRRNLVIDQLNLKISKIAQSLEIGDQIENLERLAFMAEYKYDHYDMFQPGGRFFDYFGRWLKQFDVEDRKIAIEMLCNRMVFISQREMQELAHYLYYNVIVPNLFELIIDKEKLPAHAYRKAFDSYYKIYLRKTLFIGLSDSARIDYFRRHHIELSQDQVIPYYKSKHIDYLESLRSEINDPKARFQQVILVDDFTASGYTLLRKEDDGTLKGSLMRVLDSHKEIIESADLILIAYYIASQQAIDYIENLIKEIPEYAGKTKFVTAMCLKLDDTVKKHKDEQPLNKKIRELCEKYYDTRFENAHRRKGGSIRYGFGGSGLTFSMHSNTPNNSIYILWLEQDETENGKHFYPLFKRIDRHRLR
jgi:hypothetical protein